MKWEKKERKEKWGKKERKEKRKLYEKLSNENDQNKKKTL